MNRLHEKRLKKILEIWEKHKTAINEIQDECLAAGDDETADDLEVLLSVFDDSLEALETVLGDD